MVTHYLSVSLVKCSKFIRADVAFISSDSAHSVWCNFSLPKHKQLTNYNLNAESPSGLCANSELQTKKNTHILFSVFVPRVELTHLSAARAPNCKKGTFHSISLTVLHARSLVYILLLDRAIVDSQKKKKTENLERQEPGAGFSIGIRIR